MPLPPISGAGNYKPVTGPGSGGDKYGAFGGRGGIDNALPDGGAGSITTGFLGSAGGNFYSSDVLGNDSLAATGDQLLRGLYQKTPDEIKSLQQQFKDAGVNGIDVNGIVDGTTEKAYANLLTQTQLYQTANPNAGITPDELLGSLAKAGKGSSLAKTINETSTSTNITDPIKARQTLVQAMADKLGRKPTDQEIATFTQSLNAYETQNPTVTNTTLTTDDTGTEKSRTSTTTGKATDPGAQALDYIQNQHGPEQKAVNHLNWYNVALAALTGGGVNTGLST